MKPFDSGFRLPLLLLFFVFVEFCASQDNSNLVSVIVMLRHGARNPLVFFPNDPYIDEKFWPDGIAALSKRGMMDMYQLGKWLRRRYDGFLPRKYHQNDIYVVSTGVDRTIMSAATALAGLYPPTGRDVWNPQIRWQPIPIHSVPIKDDIILRNELPCPKYQQLKEDLWKSEYFQKVNESLQNTFSYLTEFTGKKVDTLSALNSIFDSLFIEEYNNMTLPNWTSLVYPEKLQPWVDLFFITDSYTEEMARLRSGPLLHEILQYFIKLASNSTWPRYKMKIYSAHDSTLSNLLNTLCIFEKHQPPFASVVLLELRQNSSDYYVNVVYKNSTIPQNLTVKGCGVDCDLEDLVKLMKPVAISVDQWRIECGFANYSSTNLVMVLLVCVICLSICLLLFILYFIINYRKCRKSAKFS